MDEGKGKNDEGRKDEPQELTPQRPLLQLLQRDHGGISGTLGGGMHRLRLRKEGPEDAHTEGETDILEEDEGKDRGKYIGQAGLSRATLEISSEFSLESPPKSSYFKVVFHKRSPLFER